MLRTLFVTGCYTGNPEYHFNSTESFRFGWRVFNFIRCLWLTKIVRFLSKQKKTRENYFRTNSTSRRKKSCIKMIRGNRTDVVSTEIARWFGIKNSVVWLCVCPLPNVLAIFITKDLPPRHHVTMWTFWFQHSIAPTKCWVNFIARMSNANSEIIFASLNLIQLNQLTRVLEFTSKCIN